jgi:hypothetical protein
MIDRNHRAAAARSGFFMVGLPFCWVEPEMPNVDDGVLLGSGF